MNEEFEDINSRIPDIGSVIAARIANKKASITGENISRGTVDPYQLMLQKKTDTTTDISPESVIKWPEEDVKKLQDYCSKMGIVGYNSGKTHPLAALALLKKQFGEDYTGVPLESRIPEGYEKRGTISGYGPNFPYSEAMKKKQILHG